MENYAFEGARIVRELSAAGRVWRSGVENRAELGAAAASAWWQSFLRGAPVFPQDGAAELPPIRVVDAFCGAGGFTLGAAQASIAVGRRFESVAAIDVDEGALEVHKFNFGTKHIVANNASSLVDFHVSGSGEQSRFAYEPEVIEPRLATEMGKVDLFLAGPPCQGHSNLNNRTRREDPRNLLYLTAVALAVGLKAKFIAIENVPEVVNDKSDVVSGAKALLKAAGYGFIDSGVLANHEPRRSADPQALLPHRRARRWPRGLLDDQGRRLGNEALRAFAELGDRGSDARPEGRAEARRYGYGADDVGG